VNPNQINSDFLKTLEALSLLHHTVVDGNDDFAGTFNIATRDRVTDCSAEKFSQMSAEASSRTSSPIAVPTILPVDEIPQMQSNCFFSNTTALPLTDQAMCYLGMYCPNLNSSDPTTIPVKCVASPECEFRRLQGLPCQDGPQFGSQGRFEPIICPKRYYCQTPQDIKKCPQGYFCPTGTFEPRKCDLFSSCPEGSFTQTSFTGIISFLVIDVFIALLCIARFWHERKRVQDLQTIHQQKQSQSLFSDDVKRQLAANFQKSMNGKELRMHFRMEQLGWTLPSSGKVILEGVSGSIVSSRMTAIVGPSGAGKTTFMNILTNKIERTHGKLYICEKEVELSQYKKICGFVPQDDVMHRELTVRENIYHSARIRLPRSWSDQEVNEHVDLVLQALDLVHVQHTLIGDGVSRGISGGQRKRVNIALEVASCPLTLCLDEPTSGLDSTAALEVVDMLRRMADLGMTVISVIHQPRVEIFKKFDEVLCIAPGGKTAYMGPTSECRPFFEKLGYEFPIGANEADVLMDILSGSGKNPVNDYSISDLVSLWENQSRLEPSLVGSMIAGQEESNPIIVTVPTEVTLLSTPESDWYLNQQFHVLSKDLVQERGASFFTQLCLTHNLSLLQQFRTLPGLVLELFVASVSGVLMGVAAKGIDELYQGMMKKPFTLLSPAPIYWLVIQFIMLVGTAVGLSSAPAGTKIFSEELDVYWRYTSSGHSRLAYYLGKTVSSLYRIVLAGLHFSALLFYLATPVIPYYIQFGIIVCYVFGVYGLCSFVSMIVRRENATLLAVVVALFSGVFCGYGLTLNDARKWNIYFVWAMQFNMYGAQTYLTQTLKVYDHIYDSQLCNDYFGYSLDQTPYDFLLMILIGLLWRVAAFFAMILCNRDKQK
jgi:ABC-type multidrug transport system ATPase subunit